MEVNIYNQNAEIVGKSDLPDSIFGVKLNSDLMHQALTAQLANARKPIAHTKDRSEVRGGGKKPWKQKGTGRARHGSIRSPIWIGGGVTFGPRKEKIYKVKINKKQKCKALFMALSSKINDKEMALLDKFEMGEVKTKKMAGILDIFSKAVWGNSRLKKTLVVLPKSDRKILLSTRNIPAAKIISADSLNIYDLLAYKYLIIPKDAIGIIEKTYKM
ncbi:MAG: 50S ribosomal protein L4 [Patescibacteria group bacterium]